MATVEIPEHLACLDEFKIGDKITFVSLYEVVEIDKKGCYIAIKNLNVKANPRKVKDNV